MSSAVEGVRCELRKKALQHVATARILLQAEGHQGPHPLEDVLGDLQDAENTLRAVLTPPEDPEDSF